MSPDTFPNPTGVGSVALPARFLFPVTKIPSEPLKRGKLFVCFWLMFSEVPVHSHAPPCVCTESIMVVGPAVGSCLLHGPTGNREMGCQQALISVSLIYFISHTVPKWGACKDHMGVSY